MLVQFCHFGDPHRDCKDLNPPPTLTSMRGDTNQLTTSVMILNWNNTLASTIDKIFWTLPYTWSCFLFTD